MGRVLAVDSLNIRWQRGKVRKSLKACNRHEALVLELFIYESKEWAILLDYCSDIYLSIAFLGCAPLFVFVMARLREEGGLGFTHNCITCSVFARGV